MMELEYPSWHMLEGTLSVATQNWRWPARQAPQGFLPTGVASGINSPAELERPEALDTYLSPEGNVFS